MRRSWLLLLALLLSCSGSTAPDAAHQLETRLYAPCCWRQTLADHESPLATELRAEIETRVASGESAAAIETSLVARYGDRIRALGRGPDPYALIGLVTATVALLGLGLVIAVVRRSRRPRASVREPVAVAEADEALVDRLDDELAVFPD